MPTVREQFYKPFRILDETVTTEHIVKSEHVLRRERFTFGEVRQALVGAGVANGPSDRGADKLLQRARKMGLVAFDRGLWRTQAHNWAPVDRRDLEAQ